VLIPVDLSERGSAVAVAERAVAELGVIDIVIINAGLTRPSPKPESQSSVA
jgi:NAD(P)-dependent dehydrogenase (short-subunit alcohol dehydrogenase family)